MNNSEVKTQIDHMVAFIQQEGREKAREIGLKADEEHSIERMRMIEAEKSRIRADYEKKEKQVDIQRRIQQSKSVTASKMEIVTARDEALKGIAADAKAQLPSIVSDSTYPELLEGLIVEALKGLAETESVIKCKADQKSKVDGKLSSATAAYKKWAAEEIGEDFASKIKVTVSSEAIDCIGGVMAESANGKIKLNNTLEARLDLALETKLAQIRKALFGSGSAGKYA